MNDSRGVTDGAGGLDVEELPAGPPALRQADVSADVEELPPGPPALRQQDVSADVG